MDFFQPFLTITDVFLRKLGPDRNSLLSAGCWASPAVLLFSWLSLCNADTARSLKLVSHIPPLSVIEALYRVKDTPVLAPNYVVSRPPFITSRRTPCAFSWVIRATSTGSWVAFWYLGTLDLTLFTPWKRSNFRDAFPVIPLRYSFIQLVFAVCWSLTVVLQNVLTVLPVRGLQAPAVRSILTFNW